MARHLPRTSTQPQKTPAHQKTRALPEGSQTPTTLDVLLDDLSRITVDERGTVTAVAADLIRQVRPGDRVAQLNQGNRPLDVALLARRLVAVSEGRCVLTIERDDRSEPQSPRSPWSPGTFRASRRRRRGRRAGRRARRLVDCACPSRRGGRASRAVSSRRRRRRRRPSPSAALRDKFRSGEPALRHARSGPFVFNARL